MPRRDVYACGCDRRARRGRGGAAARGREEAATAAAEEEEIGDWARGPRHLYRDADTATAISLSPPNLASSFLSSLPSLLPEVHTEFGRGASWRTREYPDQVHACWTESATDFPAKLRSERKGELG